MNMLDQISGSPVDPGTMTASERAVFDVIERETTAFLTRDLKAWADCWTHDGSVRRLGACMGGIMDYHEGWDHCHSAVSEIMRDFPEPNPDAAASMRRSNISMRLGSDMAWVSYDQYGERSDDPLVTVGLSHQIRILEKIGGKWKIAMVGHGDTMLEYFDFPVVRIDMSRRVTWMNDQARTELKRHPALLKSAAFLRGRTRRDEASLKAAVDRVSQLNVMLRRPSLMRPKVKLGEPLILEGEDMTGLHIVWVTHQDGMILVSFRDRRSEASRIEEAAGIYGLSPTQIDVCRLLLEGHDIPEIADDLGITRNTAKTHLTRIFDKTGARSQTALIATLLGVEKPG